MCNMKGVNMTKNQTKKEKKLEAAMSEAASFYTFPWRVYLQLEVIH